MLIIHFIYGLIILLVDWLYGKYVTQTGNYLLTMIFSQNILD